MYRQSPSRNQRSKGIKVKNVLQICLLLAVCFWLLYQVKHSHDKKDEFDEADAKSSVQTSSDELIKLGRKDIRTRVEDTDSKNEIHDEISEEEETTEEVEEDKHGEEDLEDKKVEEREDDEAGGRDDEREEHEEEKSDPEIDREQSFVENEEREDSDETETQETDSEDGHGQKEKETGVDDSDHDANDMSAHEAREEHYKADDASSAVTHDNDHVENSNEHPGNVIGEEAKENNNEETYESEDRKDLEVDGSEAARDGQQSNVTATAIKNDVLHNSENDSTPNKETMEESDDHLMSSTKITEVTVEDNELPSENATESKPELGNGQENVTEVTSTEGNANSSILNVDSTHSDTNSTLSSETKDAESLSEELSDSSNEGNTTESSSEKNNEFGDEKSDTSVGTDESLETTLTDNPEEIQEDAIDISDTSNSLEEKDIRTDLDTLPEIQTEGTNSEDVAAE